MDTNFFIIWFSSILTSISIDNSKFLKEIKDISNQGYKIDFRSFKKYKDNYGIVDKSFLLCFIPLLNIMYSLIEYKDYYYPDDFIIKLLKENNVITKISKKELESYLNFNNSFYALIINLIYNIKLLNAKQYYYQDLIIYYEDDKDIYLEVKTDLIQHSEVEKDVLKKVESYCQKNSTDFNILVQQYFDISILVKSDQDVVGTLNKLDHPVSFTLKIPEGMKQSGRKLSVLRIHEGYVEELDTVMLSDDVLMFSTDRFSTYVLVSKEDVQNVETEKPQTESTESTSQSTQSSQQNQSPDTGDEQSLSLYVTLCTLSLVVGIVAIYLHRRKNI